MNGCDLGLVITPLWDTENPVLGPALLKSFLAQAGHRVFSHDFAIRLYKDSEGFYRDAFEKENRWRFGDPQFVASLFQNHVSLVDRSIEELLDSGASVFGFSLYIENELSTIAFARRLKARDPGRLIVFGGPSCNRPKWHSMRGRPEYLDPLDVADAIVPGEGEWALKDLLEKRKQGKFTSTPGTLVKEGGRFVWGGEGRAVEDLDSLPFPDFSDCRLEDYRVPDQLVTYMTRGCIRRCEFCDVGFNWGSYRTRTGERVFEEIRHLVDRHPDVRRFWFCDSIVNANMKELESLCDRLLAAQPAMSITWQAYAIIRHDMTTEFAEKMYRAGCRQLHIGIESGSQNVLNAMKKGFHVKTAQKVLRTLGEAGIKTNVLLMVGYPTETEEDFCQTIEFLQAVKPYIYTIVPSQSFTYIDVGTPLYEKAYDTYGIEAASMHSDFWQTRDGSNTYPVRLERFERLCDEAERMGVRIEANLEIVRASRERLLNAYHQFQQDVAPVPFAPRSSSPSRAGFRQVTVVGHWLANTSLTLILTLARRLFVTISWLVSLRGKSINAAERLP